MIYLKTNYYIHLLLTSKYFFVIKLAILLGIYLIFTLDSSTDIAFCTTSKGKKLKKALEEVERLQFENYCLYVENEELKLKSLLDPQFENGVSIPRVVDDVSLFRDTYYPLCAHQTEYELYDGRILRYAGLKIGENTFQEIYYPPNHPQNGFKPWGEAIRTYAMDEKKTSWFSSICNIS